MDQLPAPPPTIDFDHYGISVTDLNRSLDFYRDILGAIVILAPHTVDEFGFRRAVIWLNGSLGIDINEHAANSGGPFDAARTGLDHLAFSVASYEALCGWAAYLDSRSVAHSPIQNVEGVGQRFDFRDPDAIPIELWHRDHDGTWADYVAKKLEQAHSDVPAPTE